ncbi:MAG: porphobilinogen synthase [Pseudobdellovibrionaceae bacterium]
MKHTTKPQQSSITSIRPRRLRRNPVIRDMVAETFLGPEHLVQPVFILEGSSLKQPIASMPGQFRFSLDQLFVATENGLKKGINKLALFPVIADQLKSKDAAESYNPEGFLPQAVQKLKNKFPEVMLFTDVALDPYSSDGHDGLVENGEVLNDATVEVLVKMAVVQAAAGADFVCPSDMMDGRIGAIRHGLDQAGFVDTGILSYAAKYASAFYGPFRDALDSAPRFGDKKTYQMDYRNSREALREVMLDVRQGADIVMVKPGLPYLDIIAKVRANTQLPVAAYNVSGEYAMIKAAAEKGWIDGHKTMMESLYAFRRAGADLIFTYFAWEF